MAEKKPPIPRWAGLIIVVLVLGGVWFAASRGGKAANRPFTVTSEGSAQLSRDMDSLIGATNVTIHLNGPETATASYTVGDTTKDVTTFPKEIKVSGLSGDDVTVRVDNRDTRLRADVTCSIEINGVEVDSASDSTTASCFGSV